MNSHINKRVWRYFFTVAIVGLIAACFVAIRIGESFSRPTPASAGEPPFDFPYEDAYFSSSSGSTISAWHFPVDNATACVVLLHGVRSNRWGPVHRVPFLRAAGYSVLTIDFQAHGESPGDHITFGYLESRDARASVRWMREKYPGKKVAVIGISMGAAAAVLGDDLLGADAVILETMYGTLAEAVDNRMRMSLGSAGPLFSWVLLVQSKPRLGFWPSELRPIERISDLNAPVFIIAGAEDRHTTIAESKRIFDRAREPKEFWAVPGARHDNIWSFAQTEYERRVLDFLARSLGTADRKDAEAIGAS
ncbi:MAG: alpha/beta fold hydrolase [Candidatus Hydrogenedentes bacterium]|nr:alpha/beta fold hydrolase [Candidatus Hydrogenedentota bacterium]